MPLVARSPSRWLLLLCVLGCSGCSWLFVDTVPVGYTRMTYVDCTSSRVAPILDTIGGVVYGISGVSSLAVGQRDEFDSDTIAPAVVGLGVAALATASAIYGYTETHECEQAKSQLIRRRIREVDATAEARCARDMDCKGTRICEYGLCVQPPAAGALPPPAPLDQAAPPDQVPQAQQAPSLDAPAPIEQAPPLDSAQEPPGTATPAPESGPEPPR